MYKMLLRTDKTLYQAGLDNHDAKDHLRVAWYESEFRRLLVENLQTPTKRIVEPPVIDGEQYEFDSIDLTYLVPYAMDESIIYLSTEVTYESWEYEICNSKRVYLHLSVPVNLIKNPKKKAFREWAKAERGKQLLEEKEAAQKVLDDINKRLGIKQLRNK